VAIACRAPCSISVPVPRHSVRRVLRKASSVARPAGMRFDRSVRVGVPQSRAFTARVDRASRHTPSLPPSLPLLPPNPPPPPSLGRTARDWREGALASARMRGETPRIVWSKWCARRPRGGSTRPVPARRGESEVHRSATRYGGFRRTRPRTASGALVAKADPRPQRRPAEEVDLEATRDRWTRFPGARARQLRGLRARRATRFIGSSAKADGPLSARRQRGARRASPASAAPLLRRRLYQPMAGQSFFARLSQRAV